MSVLRDAVEVDALVTDRYLESLLATRGDATAGAAAFGWEGGDLDRGVRLASLRLRRDLPRFHPSFRFEERLALRLAEAAATLQVQRAAGSEGAPVPMGRLRLMVAGRGAYDPAAFPPAAFPPAAFPPAGYGGEDVGEDDEGPVRRHARPIIIGSAVASAAISIAGAAIVAWRRSHQPVSPMARAARMAHAARPARSGRAGAEGLD